MSKPNTAEIKTMTSAEALSRLVKLGAKYHLWFYLTLVVAVALSYVSSYRPILVKQAIDQDIIANKSYVDLYKSLLMVGLFLLGEVVLQFVLVVSSSFLAQKVIRELRIKIYNKIIHFKLSYFDNTPIGSLITRSVSDVETIAVIFTDGVLMVLGDVLRIVFVLVAMYSLNVELSNIVIVILPVMMMITRWFQKAIKKTFTEERVRTAEQNSFVQERLSGMSIVHLFNQQEREHNKFVSINKLLEAAYLKTIYYFSLFMPVVEVISGIVLGVVIYYSGRSALEEKGVTAGDVIAFVTYIGMLIGPMRQIADRFNTLQRGVVGAERVFTVLDSNHRTPDNGTVEKEKIKGDIRFNKVNFSYVEGQEILKQLSFEMKAGEQVAIVGATGAGKSTIINLLSRFYDISGGHIYVDEIDVREYKLKNLRSHISVVLQDVFLFNDTILENITMGEKTLTLDVVRKAAKEIGIDDFIMSLPGEYEYIVTERGGSISLGQRQLISFLRAYLYNPSILVLDEATSSIDTASEELIQTATERLTKNRTSIIIAHRLSTIKKANKIIVLELGKIVEMGSHDELLQKKGGHYQKLYEAQYAHLKDNEDGK